MTGGCSTTDLVSSYTYVVLANEALADCNRHQRDNLLSLYFSLTLMISSMWSFSKARVTTMKSSYAMLAGFAQVLLDFTCLFLVWVAELGHSLDFAQTLGEAGFALLAPVRPRKFDFLKTGGGGAGGGRPCNAARGTATAPALGAVDLDFTVLFNFVSASRTVSFHETFLFVLLLLVSRRRAALLSDGQRDGDICRRSPFVPLSITIARKRRAIEGIEGRLATDELRTGRSPGLLRVDVDLKVPIHDGLAAIRGQGLVGDLGRRGFVEQVMAAASVEAVVFAEHLALALPLHHASGRGAALIVVAEVDVAATGEEAVVLMEVEVVLDVARRRSAAGHALEPVAVPPFAATGGIVMVIQGSGRGTIHGAVCGVWCAAWSEEGDADVKRSDSCGALGRLGRWQGAVQRNRSSGEQAEKADETRKKANGWNPADAGTRRPGSGLNSAQGMPLPPTLCTWAVACASSWPGPAATPRRNRSCDWRAPSPARLSAQPAMSQTGHCRTAVDGSALSQTLTWPLGFFWARSLH